MSSNGKLNFELNDDDEFEGYFSGGRGSRAEHRYAADRFQHKRHKKKENNPKNEQAALTDDLQLENQFLPTYAANLSPDHFERQWIIDSLGGFYRDNIILDVISHVKKGKEANVYSCVAAPETGLSMIAAKLYRPRMLRHLRNDAAYKLGRFVRDESGKTAKGRRVHRALNGKSEYGKELSFANWIGHEYRVHNELYAAGADVPKPIAYRDATILMELVGDEDKAARTLIDTNLERNEAVPLFNQIFENIELMLQLNHIHGDLSAYNILYWQGEIKIIDFPQMVDARTNPNAFKFLGRDIQRICEYFANYGVESDHFELTQALWSDYMRGVL